MKLTLKEEERLIIFEVAEMARRRWKRGLKQMQLSVMNY